MRFFNSLIASHRTISIKNHRSSSRLTGPGVHEFFVIIDKSIALTKPSGLNHVSVPPVKTLCNFDRSAVGETPGINLFFMKKTSLTCKLTIDLSASIVLLALAATASAAPLTAGTPITLAGLKDGFDFIRMDTAGNRLIMGHEGNKTFDVFDVEARKLVKAVDTSTSQDAVTDVKNGKYYVSGNDPGRMVIVDSKTLEITGDVPVPSDTDLIAFNPNAGLVYESNDKAGEVWVIDPSAKKIVTTIKYDGSGVEDLAFDPEYKHLYQAIKGKLLHARQN